MSTVVITGASGMIGSTLSRVLLDAGHTIYAVVRPGSHKLNNLPEHDQLKLIECDANNLSNLAEQINVDCDVFYHFAWQGTFGDSRNDTYLQNLNVKNTLDAVQVAAKLGCRTFIGAGSQAEYGRVSGSLSPETSVNPDNGYGIAKYTAGKLGAIYAKQLGMKHIWGRILSVYGPYDNGFTMVTSTINKLLSGERPQFTAGEQLWDFIYSVDAARAFHMMAESGRDGGIYCVGSGQAKPLKEYILQIRDTIDPSLDIGIGEIAYAPNQVMHLCADIRSLIADTGFAPQMSFAEGIRHTVDWCKNTSKQR